MNKTQKVDLLYQKAKGNSFNASPEEMRELRRYKIDAGSDAPFATKANIRAYVNEVDNNGYRFSFYDWCMNNNKADRRRKGYRKDEIASFNRDQGMAVVFIGWLTWGLAVYWFFGGALSVGPCAIAGAIISFLLFRVTRKWAMFTVFLLPLILAGYFGTR